jgi:hypothetical protein
MSTARIRSLLAATAVAAVLAYGLFGHGVPQMSHDGMAGVAAGLCILLVAALPYLALPKPEARDLVIGADTGPSYATSAMLSPLDAKARASPRVLQRFRN